MQDRTCSIEDCNRPVLARGWCRAHYLRWTRNGHTDLVKPSQTPQERFWSRVVESETGCWLWTGFRDKKGYGHFSVKGRHTPAHRWAYEAMIAPIPEGLHIDHLCRTPACVNPYHLDPVTIQVNYWRGDDCNVNKTQCKHGHAFTPENTRVEKNGRRQCRECLNRRARERRERRAQQNRHPGLDIVQSVKYLN